MASGNPNLLTRRKQFPMETPTKNAHLPEAILTEIQARLPLRSISRFKSVCKTWKSTLESVYFRRLFVSLHQNSSSSWSLMSGVKELIGFHGCETWGLPKSLASYIPPAFKGISPLLQSGNFGYAASSNGLVLIERDGDKACYVGNPVLQQWVEIPSPPDASSFVLGLATRLDYECGVVLGFKVVRFAASLPPTNDAFSDCLSLCVYSSETGIWTSKELHCPHHITNFPVMILNGMLFFSQNDQNFAEPGGVLMSHDFYAESDHFSLIPLPDQEDHNQEDFKRPALTTSRGFVMYIKTLGQKGDNLLRVWRLIDVSDDGCWQLLWGIRLPFDISSYAPMAMHPFDRDIVYIWSLHNRHLVTCNLRTQNYTILGDAFNDDENCFIDQSVCDKDMDEIWGSRSDWDLKASTDLFQFVLPRWMESVPRPPQVEMIDTTSLLTLLRGQKKRVKVRRCR